MYVCGPTVYDHAHIGNARPLIVFDVLFRLLRHLYGESHVTYVRNITDVDDKINARAAAEHPGLPLNQAIRKVTEKTERQFHEDVAALGCLPPTHEPRATEHITDMVAMIAELVANGHAYVAEGHVLFDVHSWKGDDGKLEYGRLANRSLDDMIAGARVEVAPYKRDPMDFVLWKPSAPDEPSWPSPWGAGRPGWHIECSAMAGHYLGETFDIHGGGVDLVFPHHENELAQSRCAHGTEIMARYWLHNGFLQVEGEKMSKSLGNFITIRDLLSTDRFGGHPWLGETLRFAMLQTHYRQPIDWSIIASEAAHAELQAWAQALDGTRAASLSHGRRDHGQQPVPPAEIIRALDDDLNTPQAIAEARSLFSRLRRGDDAAAFELMDTCEFLGILRADKLQAFNQYHVGGKRRAAPSQKRLLDRLQIAAANDDVGTRDRIDAELRTQGLSVTVNKLGGVSYELSDEHSETQGIEQRISARAAARKAKDFAEADRIRRELEEMGVQLMDRKDTATGELTTEWEVKR
jgi:cysteinyl-tRNA synthetase